MKSLWDKIIAKLKITLGVYSYKDMLKIQEFFFNDGLNKGIELGKQEAQKLFADTLTVMAKDKLDKLFDYKNPDKANGTT